jgi:hypothetical protein
VHFFARQHVADGFIAHAINRTEIAADQMIENFVAALDAVAGAMPQKTDAAGRKWSGHSEV